MQNHQDLSKEMYKFVNSNKQKKSLIVSTGEETLVESIIYENIYPVKIIMKKQRRNGTVKLVLEKIEE